MESKAAVSKNHQKFAKGPSFAEIKCPKKPELLRVKFKTNTYWARFSKIRTAL